MKRISLKNYDNSLGTLIDIESYEKEHVPGSINIPYQKLIYNYQKLLDKNKPYYIICSGGIKSRKIVSILELYGYNVTQVFKE